MDYFLINHKPTIQLINIQGLYNVPNLSNNSDFNKYSVHNCSQNRVFARKFISSSVRQTKKHSPN